MDQKKIGKFICEMRKRKNLTQLELANKLGVTDRAISHWENGRRMPDLSIIKPLCNELDITVNDLLSGEIVDKDKLEEKLEENLLNNLRDVINKAKRNELISKLIYRTVLVLSVFALFFVSFDYLTQTEEERSLNELRNRMDEKVAVAYYGNFKYPIQFVDDLFRSVETYDRYPFIKNIPLYEMVDMDGDEFYLIVPKDSRSLITVYENIVEWNGRSKKGNPLYVAKRMNGHPIIMSVNPDKNNSNVIVEIKDKKGDIFDFQLKLNPEDSKIDLSGYEGKIKDISNYYKLKQLDNKLFQSFDEEDIYGKWKSKYKTEDNTYIIEIKLNEDHTVIIECKDKEEKVLFVYEGIYKFSTEHDLKYGQIQLNMNLKSNETNFELQKKMESVYQLVPFAYRNGFKMQFVSGQTNDQSLEHPIYEFEHTYK